MGNWRLNGPRLTQQTGWRRILLFTAVLLDPPAVILVTTASPGRALDAGARNLEILTGLALFWLPTHLGVRWINADVDVLTSAETSTPVLQARAIEQLKVALEELRLGSDRASRAIDQVERTAAVLPGIITVGASLVVGHIAVTSIADARAVLGGWAVGAAVSAAWAAIECVARYRPLLGQISRRFLQWTLNLSTTTRSSRERLPSR